MTTRMVFKRVLLMGLALFVNQGLTRTQAQTPTPTPSEEQQELEKRRDILNLQKEIAEDEKAIAEAEKAKREAKFPKPSTSPLAGTTTVDGAVIESQMVAYASMARAANKMVTALKFHPATISNLAVFNENDVKLLLSYKVANQELLMLKAGYERLLADSVIASCGAKTSGPGIESFEPFSIAESFLGSFVDLTALLRTNVEIKGQSFDIDEAPLVSEVFRAARCQYGDGIKLYYPAVFPPDVDPQKKYEILGLLERLQCLRVETGKLLSAIDKNQKGLDKVQGKIEALESAIEQNKTAQEAAHSELRRIIRAHCPRASQNNQILDQQLSQWGLSGWLSRFCSRLPADQRERLFNNADVIAQLEEEAKDLSGKKDDAVKAKEKLEGTQTELWSKLKISVATQGTPDDIAVQLKALNEQFDKLIASFLQTETATNINQLTMFVKAENLRSVLPLGDSAKSYWLQLKVIKAGGNNRIKTNLLWDIFTGGNRLSHSGGAIIEYILYDTAGRAVASDTLTEYTNYIKAGKIKNLSNSAVDDTGCPCSKSSLDCSREKEK